jgi:hypothetical protein
MFRVGGGGGSACGVTVEPVSSVYTPVGEGDYVEEIFSLILHCVVELEHASVAQALSSF